METPTPFAFWIGKREMVYESRNVKWVDVDDTLRLEYDGFSAGSTDKALYEKFSKEFEWIWSQRDEVRPLPDGLRIAGTIVDDMLLTHTPLPIDRVHYYQYQLIKEHRKDIKEMARIERIKYAQKKLCEATHRPDAPTCQYCK